MHRHGEGGVETTPRPGRGAGRWGPAGLAFLVAVTGAAAGGRAQEGPSAPREGAFAPQEAAPQEKDTPHEDTAERLRKLEERNRELERRLETLETKELEAKEEGPGEQEMGQEETAPSGLGARYGRLRLTFQLFGDVGFEYVNPEPPRQGNAAFGSGSVDFFATAQIGDHFQVLSETVIKIHDDDATLNQERLWASWTFDDPLYVRFGLEHTPVSRWNRLYHHGRWLEMSVTRPFLARFEGDGGFLPMHYAGLELGGRVETRPGRLQYAAIVSNGAGPTITDRQRGIDNNDAKAYDAALGFSPVFLRGLQVGGSFRFDEIPGDGANPARKHSIQQFLGNGYVELRRGRVEALSEVVLVSNEDRTSDSTFHHVSAYVQVGYRVRDFTPYARFDWRDMENGDPYLVDDGRDLDRWEQVFGIRYDFIENAAIKVESGFGRGQLESFGDREWLWTTAAQLAWYL